MHGPLYMRRRDDGWTDGDGVRWGAVGYLLDGGCGGGFSLRSGSAVDACARESPLDGSAYVFRNRRANWIKVLVVDAQEVWLATRRLHEGRFMWMSSQDRLASLTHAQFRWLCVGVD